MATKNGFTYLELPAPALADLASGWKLVKKRSGVKTVLSKSEKELAAAEWLPERSPTSVLTGPCDG